MTPCDASGVGAHGLAPASAAPRSCIDAQAVAAVAYNLLLARARAGRVLPTELQARGERFDRDVVGSVTLRGPGRIMAPRVLDADHSPNSTAHVVLRLDALTLRLYDRAALDTYTKAWIKAHEAAINAFGVGRAPTIQTLLHRATQQARTPYTLDGLAMDDRSMPGGSTRIERSSELRQL